MKKKAYMAPTMEQYTIVMTGQMLSVGSVLDPESDSQELVPSTETNSGEFSAPALLDMID